MSAVTVIVVMVIAVFAYDIGRRRWQENAWRRKWKGTPARRGVTRQRRP